jgi:hypothetical protein
MAEPAIVNLLKYANGYRPPALATIGEIQSLEPVAAMQ